MEKIFGHKPLFVIVPIVVAGLFMLAMWGPTWLRTPVLLGLPAAVVIPQEEQEEEPPHSHYIEIVSGCGPYFEGTCVNLRSGPGTEYAVVDRLRIGVVLKVEDAVVQGEDGRTWHKIIFDGEIRYPERVTGDWYVVADPEFVLPLQNMGDEMLNKSMPPTAKRIIVDLSEETLYAYDGDMLFMQQDISTGLELTPTPIGTFSVFKKTPSRYMQGPIPEVSDQYYDLPGVPWNLYFTRGGAVIHGAYWHDRFGEEWSHGCVNLPLQAAKELYLQFKKYLKDGPVIASVHYKLDPKSTIPHLVVIDGIVGDIVYYNDPAAKTGERQISTADFLKAWKKRFIVIRPVKEPIALRR